MWIRSQDKKELINTTRIQADYQALYADNVAAIGRYASNERALEVLDMIQNQIVIGTSSDRIVQGEKITKETVFQMPDK